MNNSATKFTIEFFVKPDGSEWFRLVFLKYGSLRPVLIPSLQDLHRMIQALGKCEDENYPPPAQGREKLVGFLRDCVREPDYDTIAAKYKIPQRDGVRVVKTNGADIDLATAEMPLWRATDKR